MGNIFISQILSYPVIGPCFVMLLMVVVSEVYLDQCLKKLQPDTPKH